MLGGLEKLKNFLITVFVLFTGDCMHVVIGDIVNYSLKLIDTNYIFCFVQNHTNSHSIYGLTLLCTQF
jgi:hypothetical protein